MNDTEHIEDTADGTNRWPFRVPSRHLAKDVARGNLEIRCCTGVPNVADDVVFLLIEKQKNRKKPRENTL